MGDPASQQHSYSSITSPTLLALADEVIE